jgi:putative sterol carrier protein
MSEKLTVFSPEWVQKFKEEVQGSASYKDAARTWEGDMDLVILAEPRAGFESDLHLYMDLWHGDCRDIRLEDPEKGRQAKFIITASYDRWKQVICKQLEPIKGMMQGKLKLKGNLSYVVRFVKAAKELVEATSRVPTRFPDEE